MPANLQCNDLPRDYIVLFDITDGFYPLLQPKSNTEKSITKMMHQLWTAAYSEYL